MTVRLRAKMCGEYSAAPDVASERALQTLGESAAPIYAAAANLLRARNARGRVIDVGCGIGRFRDVAGDLIEDYVGVDVVRHSALPADVTFLRANLDREPIPVADASADIVVAIETIEHLENPRAFSRELCRVVKPGGSLVVTTPNQLSLLSLLSLVVKGRFVAFQDDYYPIHCTALLPVDLVRMTQECGLRAVEIGFTGSGRIPLTHLHYPAALSRLFPQALSDNVLMVARKDA
jgi:2-polyprenyl-3-methyl-5-hydroxy-6-metoxy-1,4-benzoquinol methylase